MVSICAGCDGYYPWAAATVACVAGFLYVIVSKTMASVKVDDPLDAVAVHAASGLWGILAAPIFMIDGNMSVKIYGDKYFDVRSCIHWIQQSIDDADVEWNWCCKFHRMERCVWCFDFCISQGILSLLLHEMNDSMPDSETVPGR